MDAPAERARVRVLIVAPPGAARDALADLVAADPRLEPHTADPADARDRLSAGGVGLVLAHAAADGVALARLAHLRRRPVPAAVVADTPDVRAAVAAVRAGAADFFVIPEDAERLRAFVSTVAAAGGADSFRGVASRNPKMLELFELIRDVGPTAATVLIQGETGTAAQ